MRSDSGRWLLPLALAGGLLTVGVTVAVPPAAADWLVMQDGTRMETEGPWEVRGKLVVFSPAGAAGAGGTLASLRLSEVDLAASEAATEAARNPPPVEKAAEPAREPVLVLTDADVAHVRRSPAAGTAGAGATPAGQGAEGEAAEQPFLEVVNWTAVDQQGTPDVQVVGTLRNNSDDVVTGVVLIVRLYDDEQQLMAETPALFSPTSLPPAGSVGFRALFPGIYGFATAGFEIRSSGGWRFARPAEPVPGEESP